MNSQLTFQQAIAAAKTQDWAAAVAHNQTLLDLNQGDIGALNRLGVAYSQLRDLKAARVVFKKVLEIDKTNAIAKKNLQRIENNQAPASPFFSKQDFIEEPGKTRTVELHRLAGRDVLDALAVGQECELKPKNRYISVETNDNKYVGALPEDISFRLSKLIETGNTYYCVVRSVSNSHCSVYIKELTRSANNEYVNSFPTAKTSGAALNDVDTELMIDDDIPVEALEPELDSERSGREDADDEREV